MLIPYLPDTNVSRFFHARPLNNPAELEGVSLQFQHIVKKSPKCSHGVHGRKQENVAKLEKHFKVVVVCILKQKIIINFYCKLITLNIPDKPHVG